MSVVFGVMRLDGGQASQQDLLKMSAAAVQRALDGEHIGLHGPCGLGFRQFGFGPNAGGGLEEFSSEEDTITLALAGRLDNRDELAASLGFTKGRGIPKDSELLLAAYRRYGSQLPDRLLGDFTYAIYDSKAALLTCTRDPMGVRPFYYAMREGCLLFASDLKCITALKHLEHRVNRQRIADYLVPALERVDNTSTFFEKTWRLPPAHNLTCEAAGRVETRRYWQLNPERELSFDTEEECTEAFLHETRRALACRTEDQGGMALSLSGGIDSGALAALMREQLHGVQLPTYSGVSGAHEECAESSRISGVIAQGGLSPTFLSLDQVGEVLQPLRRVLDHTTDLFDNKMSMYPALCSLAASDGVKVMLDGVDDVIMDNVEAYTSYLLRDGHWRVAWSENQRMAQLSTGETSFSGLLWADLRRLTRSSCIDRLQLNRRLSRNRREALELRMIGPELADEVDIGSRLEQYRNTWPVRMCKTLRHANAAEVSHPFLIAAVERYDRLSSAYGVEARHPYLDKRFVEFCLALPWRFKDFGGWPKITLRRAMQQRLPNASLWQRDGRHLGYLFNESRTLLMREEIMDVLAVRPSLLNGLVNMRKLSAMLDRFQWDRCVGSDMADIWTVFTLAVFLRRNSAL